MHSLRLTRNRLRVYARRRSLGALDDSLMTWHEFKEAVEIRGVKDEDEITLVNWRPPREPYPERITHDDGPLVRIWMIT